MSRTKLSRLKTDPVRIAAFCFRNLKKEQVLETDISSAVDKILQREMDVESYRVLGYLLLGILRIFSKKVEYVLDDCNKVLIKINKFAANEENFVRVETLRLSITIPDRLELDAFELDELEDAGIFRGHTAPPEEITLKERDIVCKTEGFRLFSYEKFEEFDIGENTSSFDQDIMGNALLSKLLNIMDIEVSPQSSPTDLPENGDKFQSSIIFLKEPMNIDSVVKGVEIQSDNLSGQGQQIIEDQTIEDNVPCEDETHEESSRISQEEPIGISMFSGSEKEHVLSVEAFNESHQVDTNQSSAKETSSTLCQTNQETTEVHEARGFQESIEKPQDDKSCEKGCVYHGNSSVASEIHEELIEGPVEKHDSNGKLGIQEKVSLVEDERLRVILLKSKNPDATPQSKLQGDPVGRPKRDSTTPDSMLVSTPAMREHPRFSRKRRVDIDKTLILSNKVFKKRLESAKDLVRFPFARETRRTLLTAQCVQRHRESSISGLPNRFYGPLLPCSSYELQLLFSNQKMKIPNSLKIVETPRNQDLLESPTADTPLSPSQSSDSLKIEKTPRMLDLPESQASGIPKDKAIVSQTPPLSPHENIEIESLETNEVPNLMGEETNSCGSNESELLTGWSGRTRKVASFLHQSFLHARKQREEDTVNFSQVFGGRARKESARLFYEVLVLKTTGYVEVEQKEAYGDIAITKLPKLDETS